MLPRDGIVTRILAACLLVSLALPAGAWALGELAPAAARAAMAEAGGLVSQLYEPNADIPGVAIGESPISGSLVAAYPTWDFDDVYSIRLARNERLTVSMTGDADTDFDIWLFKPASTSVNDAKAASRVVNSSQTRGTSTESMSYPAAWTGTYYLDVFAAPDATPNRGDYTLNWSVEQLATPAVTVTVSPDTMAYGSWTRLSGIATLDGEPLERARIQVQKRTYGGYWTNVNMDTAASPDMPKTLTEADGTFRYVASGITKKTEYRVFVWPGETYGWADSRTVAVKPKAWLTRPRAPKTVRRNRAFTVYGHLKPRHKSRAKHVKITAYRRSGSKWVYARNYKYKWFTTYRAKISLPYKGRWKLVATTPADADHRATTSGATYVTVK